MLLKISKERKSTLQYHLELLSLILLLSVSLLLLTLILNYKELIYPPLHREQGSPKEYVAGKVEVIEHGPRDKKRVALTFDADMTPPMYLLLKKGLVKSWYNKAIKDTLDRENVKATVFLGGLWTKAYPEEAYNLAHDPLVENGSIVVFHIHDGTYAPKTNDALVKIIPDLRKKGFEFVTISEMIGETQDED